MRDVMTNWRTVADGDLDATETLTAIELGQAPIGGWPVSVQVPEQDDGADTLDVTWEESATQGGTYREFQKSRPQVTGAGDAAAPLELTDRIQNNLPWVRAVLTVAGSTPNFGAVTVGIDAGKHRNALQQGAYADSML